MRLGDGNELIGPAGQHPVQSAHAVGPAGRMRAPRRRPARPPVGPPADPKTSCRPRRRSRWRRSRRRRSSRIRRGRIRRSYLLPTRWSNTGTSSAMTRPSCPAIFKAADFRREAGSIQPANQIDLQCFRSANFQRRVDEHHAQRPADRTPSNCRSKNRRFSIRRFRRGRNSDGLAAIR